MEYKGRAERNHAGEALAGICKRMVGYDEGEEI